MFRKNVKKFKSPDELLKYSLALASEMKVSGFTHHAKILEHRAKLPSTTGQEWLNELGKGISQIRSLEKLPKEIEENLELIFQTTRLKKPYY